MNKKAYHSSLQEALAKAKERVKANELVRVLDVDDPVPEPQPRRVSPRSSSSRALHSEDEGQKATSSQEIRASKLHEMMQTQDMSTPARSRLKAALEKAQKKQSSVIDVDSADEAQVSEKKKSLDRKKEKEAGRTNKFSNALHDAMKQHVG